jgi:ABC-type oligopeptide transport system substrate-binding subunit
LGVDVGLELYDDWGAYVDMVYGDTPALFRFGWAADMNDPDNFLALFSSGSDLASAVHFSNAEYDQLLAQAADAAGDPARRQRLYIEGERILCEEQAAVIPLFYSHIATE